MFHEGAQGAGAEQLQVQRRRCVRQGARHGSRCLHAIKLSVMMHDWSRRGGMFDSCAQRSHVLHEASVCTHARGAICANQERRTRLRLRRVVGYSVGWAGLKPAPAGRPGSCARPRRRRLQLRPRCPPGAPRRLAVQPASRCCPRRGRGRPLWPAPARLRVLRDVSGCRG